MDAISQLKLLFSSNSKHGAYQQMPELLVPFLGDLLNTPSCDEQARRFYVEEKIDFVNKNVLDIGANIGYFSFAAVQNKARHITAYEGNLEHAEFIKLAAAFLNLEDKLIVKSTYYPFIEKELTPFDITFLFNVLHHLGDDYGERFTFRDLTKIHAAILKQLNLMAFNSKTLLFQLGFNWQGNKNFPLFTHGTKKEQIQFITNGTSDYWDIQHIGVYEPLQKKYVTLNENNVARIDLIGEFLNRPIFIMQSKKLG